MVPFFILLCANVMNKSANQLVLMVEKCLIVTDGNILNLSIKITINSVGHGEMAVEIHE